MKLVMVLSSPLEKEATILLFHVLITIIGQKIIPAVMRLILRSRKPKLTVVGIRCADHATPSIR
jgi:uncharacterized protein involved in response to NO